MNRLVHCELLPFAKVKSLLELNQELLDQLGLLLKANQNIINV